MKHLITVFFLLALTACASSKPLVTIQAKVVESNFYSSCEQKSASTGERLLGAGIGYGVGSQIGKGRGKTANKILFTALGVGVANSIGSEEECKSGYYSIISFRNPKTNLQDFKEIPTGDEKLPVGHPVVYNARL